MNADIYAVLRSVLIGCAVLLVMIALLAVYGMSSSPKKQAKPRHKRLSLDPDDEDEYISTAPTMTVRQIVNAYTLNLQEAEQQYTNRPMNVTGLITRITSGKKHSHVELDEMFMCVCPKGSVKSLKPLQKVCITGTLRGKFLLDDCVMVKHPL